MVCRSHMKGESLTNIKQLLCADDKALALSVKPFDIGSECSPVFLAKNRH